MLKDCVTTKYLSSRKHVCGYASVDYDVGKIIISHVLIKFLMKLLSMRWPPVPGPLGTVQGASFLVCDNNYFFCAMFADESHYFLTIFGPDFATS